MQQIKIKSIDTVVTVDKLTVGQYLDVFQKIDTLPEEVTEELSNIAKYSESEILARIPRFIGLLAPVIKKIAPVVLKIDDEQFTSLHLHELIQLITAVIKKNDIEQVKQELGVARQAFSSGSKKK